MGITSIIIRFMGALVLCAIITTHGAIQASAQTNECVATFDFQSNTLYVPCLVLGNQLFWLDLSLIPSAAIQFQLKDFGAVATGGVTGRWEAAVTQGGVIGLLLTQSGSNVTGTAVNWPIANGKFSNGVFTGTFAGDNGRTYDFQFTLSTDSSTLDGTVIQHYNGTDTLTPLSFTRLSYIPQNPDTTPPAVNATSPHRNQTSVPRKNLVITITWSKPINGWDAELIGKIGGVQRTIEGNDLVDKSKNAYDLQTHTYTMYLQANIVLDPLTSYTLVLDSGTSVDWHDPYGVPAWPDVSSAYQITFTTGSL